MRVMQERGYRYQTNLLTYLISMSCSIIRLLSIKPLYTRPLKLSYEQIDKKVLKHQSGERSVCCTFPLMSACQTYVKVIVKIRIDALFP